ncbi:MAG: hypothetical protein IJ740_19720 [Ruminococcus sp.]|nr:hypothetical protein [Ruminococcus sp.]MBR1753073.1 hypothetical protein [Ruminococcus sp.]
MSAKKAAVVFLLFTILGLSAAVFGGIMYFSEKSRYDEFVDSCSAVTDGTVVKFESYYKNYASSPHGSAGHDRDQPHSHRDNTYYIMTVSYRVRNVDYTCEFEKTTSVSEGAIVKVHYSPELPSDCYVGDKPDEFESGYEDLFIIGIIATVIFGAVFVVMFREARKSIY